MVTTEYSTTPQTADKEPKRNTYGQVKTQRWNRPKNKTPLKEMELVPMRRSQRISDIRKLKQEKVRYLTIFDRRLRNNYNKY